jgi:D-mannonate dehydratase
MYINLVTFCHGEVRSNLNDDLKQMVWEFLFSIFLLYVPINFIKVQNFDKVIFPLQSGLIG